MFVMSGLFTQHARATRHGLVVYHPPMLRLVVLVSLAALSAQAAAPTGSPLSFTLPGAGWKPRGDLAAAMGDAMIDPRDHSGVLVFRDESAGATLQGAFGARELGHEDGASAKAAFQARIAMSALGGWTVDAREHKVKGRGETVRVEAHDADGMRSITWSAATLDGPLVTNGLLQCIYKPGSSGERDCKAIIASAKLTKLVR
jgi:hypothetical protein